LLFAAKRGYNKIEIGTGVVGLRSSPFP
jgi:hypothetical protein